MTSGGDGRGESETAPLCSVLGGAARCRCCTRRRIRAGQGARPLRTYAKRADPDQDYPWCETWKQRQSYAEAVEREWGSKGHDPDGPEGDESLARWWMARARASGQPCAARALVLMNSQIDVRNILASIQAKTLVLHPPRRPRLED